MAFGFGFGDLAALCSRSRYTLDAKPLTQSLALDLKNSLGVRASTCFRNPYSMRGLCNHTLHMLKV